MGCGESAPRSDEEEFDGKRKKGRKKGRKRRRRRKKRRKRSASDPRLDPNFVDPDMMDPAGMMQDPMDPRSSGDRPSPSPMMDPQGGPPQAGDELIDRVTYTAPKAYDTNNDGILDEDELRVAKAQGAAREVKRDTVGMRVSDPPRQNPDGEAKPCGDCGEKDCCCKMCGDCENKETDCCCDKCDACGNKQSACSCPPKPPAPVPPIGPEPGHICRDPVTGEYRYYQNGKQVGIVDREEAERLSRSWPTCKGGGGGSSQPNPQPPSRPPSAYQAPNNYPPPQPAQQAYEPPRYANKGYQPNYQPQMKYNAPSQPAYYGNPPPRGSRY